MVSMVFTRAIPSGGAAGCKEDKQVKKIGGVRCQARNGHSHNPTICQAPTVRVSWSNPGWAPKMTAISWTEVFHKNKEYQEDRPICESENPSTSSMEIKTASTSHLAMRMHSRCNPAKIELGKDLKEFKTQQDPKHENKVILIGLSSCLQSLRDPTPSLHEKNVEE